MTQVLSVALSVAAVFLLVRLLSTPLRWFWKLCINTLCGAVLLGLVNLLAPLTGLYIAVTAPAACIVGFFGRRIPRTPAAVISTANRIRSSRIVSSWTAVHGPAGKRSTVHPTTSSKTMP